MHNQPENLNTGSFLMHRLQSTNANGAGVNSGIDERMIAEMQKYLELERGRRGPQDEKVAPVTKLLPQRGRFLRVVS